MPYCWNDVVIRTLFYTCHSEFGESRSLQIKNSCHFQGVKKDWNLIVTITTVACPKITETQRSCVYNDTRNTRNLDISIAFTFNYVYFQVSNGLETQEISFRSREEMIKTWIHLRIHRLLVSTVWESFQPLLKKVKCSSPPSLVPKGLGFWVCSPLEQISHVNHQSN